VIVIDFCRPTTPSGTAAAAAVAVIVSLGVVAIATPRLLTTHATSVVDPCLLAYVTSTFTTISSCRAPSRH
jgi:hypothetical protein